MHVLGATIISIAEAKYLLQSNVRTDFSGQMILGIKWEVGATAITPLHSGEGL